MKRLLVMALLLGCVALAAAQDVAVPVLSPNELLDRTATFNFAIMSDHKGSAPSNSPEMARMAGWIEQSGAEFVIGMGDHLCKRFDNPFLDFLKQDEWWATHFYPNIADGENAYYGAGQGDWGAGGKLLEDMGIASWPNVTVRENGCEYYATIPVGDFTVHLIQLHYSDTPKVPAEAFNASTRQYLVDTLNGIEKGPRDIIIVGAHSIFGAWVHELTEEHKALVMDKCDIVLAATTHHYGRQTLPGYETSGALCVNTGSVNYPSQVARGGYLEVHVFDNGEGSPFMTVQYVNTETDDRRPPLAQNTPYLKILGGEICELALTQAAPDVDQ